MRRQNLPGRKSTLAEKLILDPVSQERPSCSKSLRRTTVRAVSEVQNARVITAGSGKKREGSDTESADGVVAQALDLDPQGLGSLDEGIHENAQIALPTTSMSPRPPPVQEPEMIGPHIFFRQISEQDQWEAKRRRVLEKQLVATKRMAEAAEEENDGGYSPKAHVANCKCERCCNTSLLQSSLTWDLAATEGAPRYKMLGTSSRLIRDVMESHGFKRLPGTSMPVASNGGGVVIPGSKGKTEWSLIWAGKHFPSSFYRTIKSPHQRVNLFPSSFEVTKKDALSRNLNRMIQVHGRRHFPFVTLSFTLPKERDALLEAMSTSPGTWIVKPAGSSQGRGIYIIEGSAPPSPCPSPPRKEAVPRSNSYNSARLKRQFNRCALPIVELAKQLPDTKNSKDNFVVEKYIERPYLIEGRKFDLRLYVGVTSFEPLKVYLHEEGLIRLASSEYSTAAGSYSDRFCHLTNYSINKRNVVDEGAKGRASDLEAEGSTEAAESADAAVEGTPLDSAARIGKGKDGDGDGEDDGDGDSRGEDSEDTGIKLRLSELGSRMQISDEELDELRDKIDDLVAKTLICAESQICMSVRTHCSFPETCFELFGFDVLIDEDLQPWLIEVNFAPSLATDTPLDFDVKGRVVADIMTLAGLRRFAIAHDGTLCKGGLGSGTGTKGGNVLQYGAASSPAKGGIHGHGVNYKTGGGHHYRDSPQFVGGKAWSAQAAYKSGTGVHRIGSRREGTSGTVNEPTEQERRIIKTFHAECRRALRTGFRLVYPLHGPASVNCIPLFDVGKEAALMLAHHMFTLRCNPSDARAIADLDEADRRAADAAGTGEVLKEDELLPQRPPKLCTTSSSPVAGDRSDSSVAFSPASSSTSRRITVEQIKSAREEARRQERAWAKAIGKAVA